MNELILVVCWLLFCLWELVLGSCWLWLIILFGGIGLVKEELLELDGIVDEVLLDSKYCVMLENGVVVGVYVLGCMCKNYICIFVGDCVMFELLVYDFIKGCINFWYKDVNLLCLL